ncbi:MAG TPA: hypothetical protein VKG38_04280 [Solirubrobacteraceae bacterium]|nr:hypothetical protein [Solirubrobacteraceae bacterium]
MEGGAGNTMDGDTQTERAVMLDALPNAQRLQTPCEHAGGVEQPEALRARLIDATVELVAELGSNPRLVETRYIRPVA